MKPFHIILAMTTIILASCSGKSQDPQSSPRAVAETIFDAAKNGKYQGLASLVDDNADGDSKRIAMVENDNSLQEEFKKYFSKGKVNSEPVVDGEKASVNILFGPDGSKEETLEMVKKDGKWYLVSF